MENCGDYRRELGKLGEDIACRLLTDMGQIILERNYRSGHLEIDIISMDSTGIHFVEVKTRKKGIQAPPQENVDKNKQKRIVRAAKAFLRSRRHELKTETPEYFFDVVAVTFGEDGINTEWFPQAYIPLYI